MTLFTACAVVKCLAFILLISALKLHHSTTSVTFIENPSMRKNSHTEAAELEGLAAVARPPTFSPHPSQLIFKDVPLLTRIKGIFQLSYKLSSTDN